MKKAVQTIGIFFVTLVILGAPVLLFLSFMLDWPFFIVWILTFITVLDWVLVWIVVETLYEEDYDG